MAEIKRASVLAIVPETTTGTLKAPTGAAQFIPLRPASNLTAAVEELESDELLNDIGASEPAAGKETPTASHSAYLKHSGTEGQEPETGPLYESILGAKSVAGAEYDTVAGSTVSVLNVDTGEGATFEEGEAFLVKDGTNGYEIRNIESISSDALTMNFDLPNAPASGVNLGQCVLYKPASSGHPSNSLWYYHANGAAVEAQAGSQVSSLSLTFTAGQFAEVEFSMDGTESFFNPFIIDATNNKCNFTDDVGTVTATLSSGVYKSPVALATEIATQMTAASVGSGNDTITCTYSSSTGKYTLASDGTTFSLLWSTGANGSGGTDTHFGTLIGFDDTADNTGATSYVGGNAIDLSAPYTPSYDDVSKIIVKSAEILVGDNDDIECRHAGAVSFTIDRPNVDVDDICAESGVAEKLPESRTATMTATLILQQYESHLYDKFVNNSDTRVMLNAGNKDSSGNWIPGECFNICFQRAKLTTHTVGGDAFVTVELTAKGYVSSTKKDVFINFL